MVMDYEALGLKVGVEVHRQLDTKHKLFCMCPTEPVENGEVVKIARFLRAVSYTHLTLPTTPYV